MAFFERLARFAQRMFQIFLMAGGVGAGDTQVCGPFFRGIVMRSPPLGGEINQTLQQMYGKFQGFPLITVHCVSVGILKESLFIINHVTYLASHKKLLMEQVLAAR